MTQGTRLCFSYISLLLIFLIFITLAPSNLPDVFVLEIPMFIMPVAFTAHNDACNCYELFVRGICFAIRLFESHNVDLVIS